MEHEVSAGVGHESGGEGGLILRDQSGDGGGNGDENGEEAHGGGMGRRTDAAQDVGHPGLSNPVACEKP